MVRDSITANSQYEGLAWRLVPSLDYVVTMAKFTVFVLHNSGVPQLQNERNLAIASVSLIAN